MFRPVIRCVSMRGTALAMMTHLVFFGLQLAVSGLACQCLDFGRDGGQTLAANILNDRGDQTVGRSDGDTDVGLLVPVGDSI